MYAIFNSDNKFIKVTKELPYSNGELWACKCPNYINKENCMYFKYFLDINGELNCLVEHNTIVRMNIKAFSKLSFWGKLKALFNKKALMEVLTWH